MMPDCIFASVQSLVISIRRPGLRGQLFPTRDEKRSYNLAMEYALWV